MMNIIKKKWNILLKRRHYCALRKSIVNSQHDINQFDRSKTKDLRKQGFSLNESDVFDLKRNNWREYITTWEAYQPRLCDSRYFCISDDKYLFSLVFGNYVNVSKTLCLIKNGNIISLNSSIVDLDDIISWIYSNNGCVIKDRDGCDGFNVFVIHAFNQIMYYKNKEIDKESLAKIISSFKNGLIQELIVQGEYGAALFPDSVNTIRIISMRKEGDVKHEIVAALQRIGTRTSSPVDNFNQGGLSAIIDLKTGVLGKATGMKEFDTNGHRLFYSKHPDTDSQIEGITVPNWDDLTKTIIKATESLPFFEYIAWDIAIQDKGFAVIETNMKSSLNVFQIHKGMRNSSLGDAYRSHNYLVDDKMFIKKTK